MNNDSESPKLSIQQTVRDCLGNINYENLGEHSSCSKCGLALTRETYENIGGFVRNASRIMLCVILERGMIIKQVI